MIGRLVKGLRFPLVATAVLCMSACAPKEQEPIQIGPVIGWQELSTGAVTPAMNGHRLVLQGTEGLFPASISLCRVGVDETDTSGNRLRLRLDPPHDVLPWNSVFDSLRAVSEAFPLAEMDLQEQVPTVERILDASAELGADLLLIYSVPTHISETTAEVKGVLFDVRGHRMLATIHASAEVLDPEWVEPPPLHVEGDDSHINPLVLSERGFEQCMIECLLDLMAHDRAMNRPVPEGWIPEVSDVQATTQMQMTGSGS
ncbi:MAG: hypothetical protein IID37_08265 [Planctomycetes bacterium]|nr:hypothetical protein [Planctomycetota bacterium]